MGLVALLSEKFVSYAHFDVVCFAGKYQGRFVLSFPSEPGNSTVVSAQVWMTGNIQRSFADAIGVHVVDDYIVRNVLNQPRAEYGGRYAKNQIPLLSCGRKVGLSDIATRSVLSSGNGKQVMDTSVSGAIRIEYESCLTYGTIRLNKERDHICGAILVRHLKKRIYNGTRASNRWL